MALSRMGRHAGMTATQEAAAHKIAPLVSKIIGGYVDPYSMLLIPARGRWAHNVSDVQRWTGHFPRPDMPKLSYTIGSWDVTLSSIAAGCRFDLDDERGEIARLRDNDFQISKPGERK